MNRRKRHGTRSRPHGNHTESTTRDTRQPRNDTRHDENHSGRDEDGQETDHDHRGGGDATHQDAPPQKTKPRAPKTRKAHRADNPQEEERRTRRGWAGISPHAIRGRKQKEDAAHPGRAATPGKRGRDGSGWAASAGGHQDAPPAGRGDEATPTRATNATGDAKRQTTTRGTVTQEEERAQPSRNAGTEGDTGRVGQATQHTGAT